MNATKSAEEIYAEPSRVDIRNNQTNSSSTLTNWELSLLVDALRDRRSDYLLYAMRGTENEKPYLVKYADDMLALLSKLEKVADGK